MTVFLDSMAVILVLVILVGALGYSAYRSLTPDERERYNNGA